MSPAALPALLAVTAVVVCTGDRSTSAAGLSVDVLGQSGKFTAYRTSLGKSDPNKVVVEMDGIAEIDAGGSPVGSGGSLSNKHGIQSFATQAFTFSPIETRSLGEGVNASMVAFDTAVNSIGQLKVETYILTQGGVVGPEGDNWTAAAGDLKWNINLSSWTWCPDSPCQGGGTGAYIDLDIAVKGSSDAPNSTGGKNSTYSLGGGVSMELTNKVTVDGNVTEMPAGFPRIETKGGKQVFTFRFPKFNNYALYDPLLRMSGEEDTNTDPIMTGGSKHSIGGFALALAALSCLKR